MTRGEHIAAGVAVAAFAGLLLLVPVFARASTLVNLTIYSSLAMLGLSLSIVWGTAGLFSLGQAAFFGLGGYAYAIAATDSGSPVAAVGVAILVAGLFAGLFGYFMFWGQVSDVFLGVMTLTVSQIFQHFVDQTGGEQWRIGAAHLGGFNGIPDAPLLDWPIGSGEEMSPAALYVTAMTTLMAAYALCRLLVVSRFGRLLIATRENEQRCGLLGLDTRLYKQGAFMFGGALAGLAGAIFANAVIVSPQMFGLNVSAQVIICVIVGGASSLLGAVIGSFLVQGARAWLAAVSQLEGYRWVDPNVALGLLLVIAVLFAPRGVAPLMSRWLLAGWRRVLASKAWRAGVQSGRDA